MSTAARIKLSDEMVETWRQVMTGRAPQPFTKAGYGDDVPIEVMREGWELQVRTDPARALLSISSRCRRSTSLAAR